MTIVGEGSELVYKPSLLLPLELVLLRIADSGGKDYYELLGRDTTNGVFQFIFKANDPIIEGLNRIPYRVPPLAVVALTKTRTKYVFKFLAGNDQRLLAFDSPEGWFFPQLLPDDSNVGRATVAELFDRFQLVPSNYIDYIAFWQLEPNSPLATIKRVEPGKVAVELALVSYEYDSSSSSVLPPIERAITRRTLPLLITALNWLKGGGLVAAPIGLDAQLLDDQSGVPPLRALRERDRVPEPGPEWGGWVPPVCAV